MGVWGKGPAFETSCPSLSFVQAQPYRVALESRAIRKFSWTVPANSLLCILLMHRRQSPQLCRPEVYGLTMRVELRLKRSLVLFAVRPMP